MGLLPLGCEDGVLFSSIIDDFSRHPSAERGLTPRAMKTWRNVLRGFHALLDAQAADAPAALMLSGQTLRCVARKASVSAQD